MLKLLALNYNVMLNGYSQWLNIRGHFLEGNQYQLVSVILAFSHKKKDDIKQTFKYTVFVLFVHKFEDWMGFFSPDTLKV